MEALRPTDPRQVGKYRLTGRLGDGGMGQVFLGQSPGGRPVAVKLIRSDLAENAAFRARFAQEVAAARRVSGLFTAPVVDADPDAEQPWLVTGYVAGPSLTEAVENTGPLGVGAVLSLAAGLAEGLAAIHAAGVVHRDLKPSNVLLAADGPRIIDFGISRALGASRLTGTGSIVGSPGFMSPEQAEGGPIGPSSDIFSLGSVITFAACGEGPFGSGPPTVLLYRIVHGTPAIGGVPAEISSLIARSLSKEASLRPTAEEFLAQLPEMADADSHRGGRHARRQPVLAPTDSRPQAEAALPMPTVQSEPPSALPTPPTVQSESASAPPTPPTVQSESASAPPTPPTIQSESASAPPTPPAGRPMPAQTAEFPAVSRRRPRRGLWVIGAIGVLAIIAAVTGLVFWAPGHAGGAPKRHPSTSPQAVVRRYIRDINEHHFLAAWRLGGDNISSSYQQFVAGFQLTKHVVIIHLVVQGTTVHVRTLASETTGPVQTYALTYVVQNGKIVLGIQHLISTTP
jgi:serine/threonine protein kinase